jgi:hypothetical protein
MKESVRDLFSGTVPLFAWKGINELHENPHVLIAGLVVRI